MNQSNNENEIKIKKENIANKNKNYNIEKKSYYSEEKYDNIGIKPLKKQILTKRNKSHDKDNKKKSIVLNPDIIYFPKYTNGNDPNLYDNIYKFLLNGIKDNKRTWPEYITKIKDKNKKQHKKLDFYKNIGLVVSGFGKKNQRIVMIKTERNSL